MKKLLIFLMISIPLVVILVVNLTVNVVAGIVSIPVDSISLNYTQVQMMVDESLALKASIFPKNATNQEVEWESTNEAVARVDLNGNVSFVGFGKGYIRAKTVDGGKIATCYFYVTDTNVHEIKISSEQAQGDKYYIPVGESILINAVVYPTEALNKNITYISEDESVATVDSNGVVKGKSFGRAKITAISEDNTDITESIIVEVIKPVERVIVPIEEEITASNTYQISYSIYPNDATISTVLYKCSDESIATVSSSGLVSFSKPGEVLITLISLQGEVESSFSLTYTDGFAQDLVLEKYMINDTITNGGTYVQYRTIPENIDVEVEFSSDEEDIAYIDGSGYIQFLAGGGTFIRVRVKKSPNEFIEKTISLYIESPATAVDIEKEYIVSSKTFKLNPKSYPETSTNENFYYKSSDQSVATVTEDGAVEFLRDEYSEVFIQIYANSYPSTVYKNVKVVYTNGYPVDMNVEEEIILLANEKREINYVMYPADTTNKTPTFEIVEERPNQNGKTVIEIDEFGVATGVSGGSVIVEVCATSFDGSKILKRCKIEVIKKVEEIIFETSIEEEESFYITGSPEVDVSFVCKNDDATNKNLSWAIEGVAAIKKDNSTIFFNEPGIVKLVAKSEDNNAKKEVFVRFLGSDLIRATLKDVPSSLNVGETFKFEVLKTTPSNSSATSYIRINNQGSYKKKIFEVLEENTIRAVSGGVAEVIYVVDNLSFKFTVTSIRLVDSILITPSNITTTAEKVYLQSEVLPEDATDKSVLYFIDNEDIATIDGGVLTFKTNGKANITAVANDGSGAMTTFYIEKIEKGTGDVVISGQTIQMKVGDKNKIGVPQIENFEAEEIEYKIKSQSPMIEGGDVVELQNDLVSALNLGSATIVCILTNSRGEEKTLSIEFEVIQTCEDIVFDSDLDVYSDEYVTAVAQNHLNFKLLPETTTNKKYTVSIISFSSDEEDFIAPYINDDGDIIFNSSGVAKLNVASDDSGARKYFWLRYTGGDAIEAEINVKDPCTVSVGEEISLAVLNWIPSNAINQTILVTEISHSQGVSKVVEINGTKITGVAGGYSRIKIELSNNITKEITINVLTKVAEIVIDDEVLTSKEKISLKPTVNPSDASNKTLVYEIEDSDIATLEGNEIIFTQAGSVFVNISTTDGSNISKRVKITSTMGAVRDINLNLTSKEISKSGSFTLLVSDYTPKDVASANFIFEIYESNSNDGKNDPVISITQAGKVTALRGGRAKIRVYAQNDGENIAEAFCDVEVISKVNGVSVEFDRELSFSQNQYVTSKNTLSFTLEVLPSDATNRAFRCRSLDETIATVSENTITFIKEGVVSLRFENDCAKGDYYYKDYKFYYTAGKLISASAKDTSITIKAGEKYTFELNNCIPIDLENLNMEISALSETRQDVNKQVVEFNNGVLTGLNGGFVSFTLKAGEIEIGDYAVHVLRDVEEIGLIGVDGQEAFTNIRFYQINAKALPSDTQQKDLLYQVVEGDASVNSNGYVSFGQDDKVIVKISSSSNNEVFTTVTIMYSNQVQKITFKESPTQIATDGKIELMVVGEPLNVEQFNVVYISSDPEIAYIKQESGRTFLYGKAAGTVNVSAYVEGRENITDIKTIQVIEYLDDIQLGLNEVNDSLGIGGYRVWGNKFLAEGKNSKDGIISNYQMSVNKTPANSKIDLIWESSDENIATVSETGLVQFKGVGDVKITVQPSIQKNSNPNYALKSSYTFKVVEGVNINTYAQFYNLTKDYAVVLQSDFKWTNAEKAETVNLKHNVYGNGHLIEFVGSSHYHKLSADRDILIDNIYLRGNEYDSSAALSTLKGKGIVLRVMRSQGIKKGVVIKNSIIENAEVGVDVEDSLATVTGSILRNAYIAGLRISQQEGTTTPSLVNVDNCIFGKALFSSIIFNLEKTGSNYKSKLVVGENVEFYNWLRAKDFNISDVEYYSGGLIKGDVEAAEMMKNSAYQQYIYEENGEKYMMLGISRIRGKARAAFGVDALELFTHSEVEAPRGEYVEVDLRYVKAIGPASADFHIVTYTLTKEMAIKKGNYPSLDYNTKEYYDKIKRPR